MASRGLNFDGVLPKSIPVTRISASANIKGILKISPKGQPGREIVDGFERAINRASVRIAQDLKMALDAAMSTSAWGGGDLVDTGELMSSGSVTVSENGITISYDAPYAALIHYGGYIHPYGNINARIYLPPRPWVESVLFGGGPVQQFDFEGYYRQEILNEFK